MASRREQQNAWLVKAIVFMGIVSFFLGKKALEADGPKLEGEKAA